MNEDTRDETVEELIDDVQFQVVQIYEEELKRKRITVFLDDYFDSQSADYRELLHKLSNLKPEDEILFRIASYGGDCHVGFQVCHAIRNCKANTIIKVEQPCYSMGAILAVSAKHLIMNPNTFLMFHNYSGGDYGKGGELKLRVHEVDKWLHNSFKYFCHPFLTEKELEDLNNDKDIYIHSWDKNLKARIKRHFGVGK